ncbi:MAG TPA: hypothetical protein VIU61_02195 [Kofleriaceae bacterium]
MTLQHGSITSIAAILRAAKLARDLLDSGVLQAGKAVLDALIDGIEKDVTPEDLEARVKSLESTLTADRADADEIVRERKRLAKGTPDAFDTSEDETMPGTDEEP